MDGINTDLSLKKWTDHSRTESEWWGDCLNTSDEEGKQAHYAQHMGLDKFNVYDKKRAFGVKYDMLGKSILDIGGGPASLLLKCVNVGRALIIDPCTWPQWVMDRYEAAGIEYRPEKAETAQLTEVFDEVWLYNTLQHVWNPEQIIKLALRHARLIRVFEWIETAATPGHPHVLTEQFLNQCFDAAGEVKNLQWAGYPMPSYVLCKRTSLPQIARLTAQPECDITVTITSTGRFNLLTRTIDSLMKTIGRPVKVIISDDSQDSEQHRLILAEYGGISGFDVYIQDENIGQAKNLDFLYGLVDTPYLFHCEDDWEFGETGYIEDSLDILAECPDVCIIGMVKDSNFERLGAVGAERQTARGTVFYNHPRWRIDEQHDWWHGWIGSPHLMRRRDCATLGSFQQAPTEAAFDRDVFANSGMKSVWLEEQYCEHIGAGRSTLSGKPTRAWSVASTNDEHPTFRFHLLGLAHVPTHRDVYCCAYTQKVVKLSKMLKSLGHTVFLYAGEGSDADCDEFIQVVSDADRKACYGDYDWHSGFFKHDGKDAAYQTFNTNAIPAIKDRQQPGDFLLCTMGTYQKPIADALTDIRVVESGIGYRGVFADRRVFESYAWMHYIYGLTRQNDGSWYDAVIPNYFELADFPFQADKEDYALYMGRIVRRKGVDVAVQVTRELGIPLIMAGQGTLKNEVEGLDIRDSHVKFLGSVGPEERKRLMGAAKVAFVPTYYIEPFGGVAVEAMLCGTPVICSDWGAMSETVLDGITGYRCRTFDDFVRALANIDDIDPHACREWAEKNYSTGRVRWQYQAYFEQINDLSRKGWYELHDRGNHDRYRRYHPSDGKV